MHKRSLIRGGLATLVIIVVAAFSVWVGMLRERLDYSYINLTLLAYYAQGDSRKDVAVFTVVRMSLRNVEAGKNNFIGGPIAYWLEKNHPYYRVAREQAEKVIPPDPAHE